MIERSHPSIEIAIVSRKLSNDFICDEAPTGSSEIHLPIFARRSASVHARGVISRASVATIELTWRSLSVSPRAARAIANKLVSMFEQTIHDRFTIIEPYVRGREVM